MIVLAAVKVAITGPRRDATGRGEIANIIRLSLVSAVATLVSLLFVLIGAQICNGRILFWLYPSGPGSV